LALVVLVGLVATPAGANPADKPVGTWVPMFSNPSPTSLTSGEAFFVAVGWGIDPSSPNAAVGHFSFRLDIDGVDQGRGELVNLGVGYEQAPWFHSGVISRFNLYNFPDGLPDGDYLFTGRLFMPCGAAVADFWYPGPCPTPNASVAVLAISKEVTVS
jgi:hypothetical protein